MQAIKFEKTFEALNQNQTFFILKSFLTKSGNT